MSVMLQDSSKGQALNQFMHKNRSDGKSYKI